MPLLVGEAIVLHSFDYLESSRIVRRVTSFGSGLDLFAQGTASI